MKKIRKNKKLIEKGGWSIGKTIASVIGSVAVISGGTIAGIYLTGGFEEYIVNPQNIDFDYGDLRFENGQLEISGVEEFTLVVSSTTENVTQKKVTLSFGEGVDVTTADGYISNKIIKVPEVVELGDEFTVQLLKKSYSNEDKGLYFEYIAGGISTLIASSQNELLGDKEIQIAVDTPIYKIENHMVDMNGNELNEIGINQQFKLKTTFYPEESRYIFADDKNTKISNDLKREKLVLFSVAGGTNYVQMRVNEKFDAWFETGDDIVDEIEIDTYSFKDAKSQFNLVPSLIEGSAESRYSELYRELVKQNENNVSNLGFEVKMASASISTFDITKGGEIIAVTYGEKESIYVNGNNGISLGAQILATDNKPLTDLLENIALEFVKTDGSALDMKDILVEGRQLNESDFITIDGHKIYLPNNSSSNKNNCYWDITSTLEQNIRVNVYLVVENATGKTLFGAQNNPQARYFYLQTNKVDDQSPTFVGQDSNFNVPQEIVTLNIKSSGTGTEPKPINLRQYIVVPTENRYQSVQYYVKSEHLSDVLNGPYGEVVQISNENWTKIISNNDTITIKGAGSFELRFATVKSNGEVVKYCDAVKSFVCQQALSKASIDISKARLTVKQAGVAITKDTAYLTRIADDEIKLSFELAPASSSVFASEFNADKIKLKVYSKDNVEITNAFSIQSNDIYANSTNLLYTLTILDVNSEREISKFVLVYEKGQNDVISWEINVPLTTQGAQGQDIQGAKIVIYSPTTETITVENAPQNVEYKQYINGEGALVTEVTDKDNNSSINGLVDAIKGVNDANIKIVDQHGRGDTLSGEWAFFLTQGQEIINLESQNFYLKGSGEAKIKIKATKVSGNQKFAQIKNGVGDYSLTITATATGVDHLTYQNDKTSSNNNSVSSTMLSAVTVEKYGKKDVSYTLSNLVKYYLDENGSIEYTKVSFKFASSYFSGLGDKEIVELYGANGMLSVTLLGGGVQEFGNDATAENIKTALKDKVIQSITINEHFGKNHTIKFDISDTNGVVNTNFTFNILKNIDIGFVEYNNKYCVSDIALTNEISYFDGSNEQQETLGDKFSGTWYINPNESGTYYLSSTSDNKIATIKDGKVTFDDFFDEESKTRTVSFNEGNSFKLNFTITFTILRNIKVESKNQTFYLLGNNVSGVDNYVSISRIDGSNLDGNNGFTYSMKGDYLVVNDENDKTKTLTKKENIIFKYKEESLLETLSVKYGNTVIAEVNIKIELFKDNDKTLYQIIAPKICSVNNQNATTQTIGDVRYIVLDTRLNGTNTTWKLEENAKIETATIKFGANPKLYETSTSNVYLNSQTQTLAGYNNSNYYLLFKLTESGKTIATIYAPVILSKVGASPITYDENKVDIENTLATALMSAKDIQEKSIYIEAVAGKEHFLSELSRVENGQTLAYDAVGGESLKNKGLLVNSEILSYAKIAQNETKIAENEAKIKLNHLSNEYNNLWLPLAWTVGDITFHYLIYVSPDVKIEGPVYAYNGNAEYIVCAKNASYEINFEAPYDNTTLHYKETRFSVTQNNQTTNQTTIEVKPQYYIKSVNDSVNEFTDVSMWEDYITFDINDSTLKITPKTDNPLTIVVGLRYISGEGVLSVVAEEKTYTIILNQNTTNYKVRVNNQSNGELTPSGISDEFTWSLSNVNPNGEENRTRTLTIELLDVNTNGTSATVVSGLLKVRCTEGNNCFSGFKYENNTFTLTLKDYISQDSEAKFILYTKYGYLATLTVKITANASVELKGEAELNGGESISFGDIFKVELDNSETPYYDITKVSFDKNFAKFAKWDGSSIKIADLFEDVENVEMTATLKFNNDDNQTFKFSQIFTLKANVSLKAKSIEDVVAGKTIDLTASDFLEGTPSQSTAKITVVESDDSFSFKENDTNVTITPKYVATKTPITIKLRITLTFNGVSQSNSVPQSKDFTYTIKVSPAAELTPNYPNPSGEEPLDREYIKNGTIGNSILAFFDGNALYSNVSRLQLSNVDLDNNRTTTDKKFKDLKDDEKEDLSITISECQNMKFTVGGDEKPLETGADVPVTEDIKFERGTTGAHSIITFTVTYKGVSEDYTVEVLDEIYLYETNYQTNNIEADKDGIFENLYFDKTINLNTLTANGRMIKATMNDDVIAGTYVFVFEENDTYYISQNIIVTANDHGKEMTYDLGYSMAGKTFVGAYLASDIADSELTLTGNVRSKTAFDRLNFNEKSLFGKDKYKLVSRIELTYGGHKVAYDKVKYKTIILSGLTTDVQGVAVFDTEEYKFTYRYKAKTDIDVKHKASQALNYITVNVNEEYESIVDLFEIYHPSTGKKVEKSEFNENVSLAFTIVKDTASFQEGYSAYSRIEFSEVSQNKPYIKIEVGKRNALNGVYDFAFLPLGAKNDGNFVLTKLTYTANGQTAEFYMVLEIIPDYKVTFDGVGSGLDEEGSSGESILSNAGAVISVVETYDNDEGKFYKEFTLVSNGSTTGYLSVKHKNGLNQNTELASSFIFSLTLDQNDFNNKTNFNSKLLNTAGNDVWEADSETTPTTYTLLKPWAKFYDVPAVVFGEQKFYIEAEDAFGFKIRLYFMLSQTTNTLPKQSSSTISITEGDKFDITAKYESLSISESASTGDKKTPIIITSSLSSATLSEGLKFIELEGIEAYGFDEDYIKNGYFKSSATDKYELNDTNYSLDDSMKRYLSLPMINYITITNIKIVDVNGKEYSINLPTNKETSLATDETLKHKDTNTYRDPSNKFEVPTLDANVYGKGTTASVTIYITLQYENGDNTEIYIVPVEATILRKLNLIDNPTVMKDGVSTSIKNIFTVKEDKTQKLEYLNDTLEVEVERNASVKFKLSTTIESKECSISNVGYSYDKTYYFSISELLGVDVDAGNSVTINVTDGSATFVYRNGAGATSDLTDNKFTISSITEDSIVVDHASLLSANNYYKQNKYYLVSADGNKYYRVTKSYYVTGKYYTMTNSSALEIDAVLNASGETYVEQWGYNLRFHDLVIEDNQIKAGTGHSASKEDLHFEIDESDPNALKTAAISYDGTITITSDFTRENYVKIKIFQKISESHHYLGVIRLGLNGNEGLPQSPAGSVGDVFKYTFSATGNTASVRVADAITISGNIIIPSQVIKGTTTYSITAIEANGFKDATNLTGVTIPSSITTIGANAFTGTSLTSATFSSNTGWKIGDDLIVLGTTAENATALKTTYASKVWTADIFAYTFSVTGNTASIKALDASTISGDIIIPSQVIKGGTTYSITSIDVNGFKDATNLTEVIIPSSVTTIGDYSFSGCSSLSYIEFSSSTTIGEYAFENCTSLNDIDITNCTLSEGCFKGCECLSSVTWYGVWTESEDVAPPSLISIPKYAFAGTALSDITFCSDVKISIGEYAFENCMELTSFDMSGKNYTPNEGTNKYDSICANAFAGCANLTTITFNQNKYLSVYQSSFNGCTSIESLTFPLIEYHIVLDGTLDLDEPFVGMAENFTIIKFKVDENSEIPSSGENVLLLDILEKGDNSWYSEGSEDGYIIYRR